MEGIGPSTRPGIGPHERGSEGAPPDTIRDGTAPLLAPHRVATVPMAVTAPLAPIARRPPRLTYDVYTPDDTLRGARAITEGEAAHATTKEREKRRRLGLGALALAVTLSTTLMAVGSCDDSATGRVETTAAVATAVTARPAPAPPTAAPATATADVIPPITFSPPLAPPPRRRGPTPGPKR